MQNIDETKPLLDPEDDLEGKPGLVRKSTANYTAALVRHFSDQGEEEVLDVENDVMMYKNSKLITWSGMGETRLSEDWEIDHLKPMRDPPGIMWMWISNMIGIMSQRTLVPGMATPTYGRIMNLCQCGHGGIRAVRAAVVVQAPLPYTNTLAVLVHFNNILNAICLGLVLGTSSGTWLSRQRSHFVRARASSTENHEDLQMLAVTFLYCFFGPLLYQSLLIMAFHLAQPFDHEDASMPLDLLLHRLEIDLRNANQLRIPDSEKARPPSAADQHTQVTLPQVAKSHSSKRLLC